ncbi:hypothetical protein M513_03522 [Trichuris suis]|uniref:TOG domain-containing protein n=2 Tax=Trichuris suis TaxID=68888 RepID=A0A085ME24_9BILA|nr:hypothetical protein M513_03522 [Trichuris suis]
MIAEEPLDQCVNDKLLDETPTIDGQSETYGSIAKEIRNFLLWHQPHKSRTTLDRITEFIQSYPDESHRSVPKVIIETLESLGSTSPFAKVVSLNAFKILRLFGDDKLHVGSEFKHRKPYFQALGLTCYFVLMNNDDGKSRMRFRQNLRNLLSSLQINDLVYVKYMNSLTSFELSAINGELFAVWSDDQEIRRKHFPSFLELYTKSVLEVKYLGAERRTLELWEPVVAFIDDRVFSAELFPLMKKVILRNPEAVLEAVGYFFRQTVVDMSNYTIPFFGVLSPYLYSSQANLRRSAVFALAELIGRIELSDIRRFVVNELFNLITGLSPKATTVDHKSSVLSAIASCGEKLSNAAVRDEELLNFALTKFVPIIRSEVHESTIEVITNAIASWMKMVSVDLPSILVEWFDEVLSAPFPSLKLCIAHLRCLDACCEGRNVPFGLSFVKHLINNINSAGKAKGHLIKTTGALYSACILTDRIKVFDCNAVRESALSWISETHEFISESFLKNSDGEVLLMVVRWLGLFYDVHYGRASVDSLKSYHCAFIRLLVHVEVPVRQSALKCLKKCLQSSTCGETLCSCLLDEYYAFLCTALSTESSSKIASRDALKNVLIAFSYGPYSETKNLILMKILRCASLPIIEDPFLWPRIVRSLRVEPYAIVDQCFEEIHSEFLNFKDKQNCLQIARTVFYCCSKKAFDKLFDFVRSLVENEELLHLDEEDIELLMKPLNEIQPSATETSKQVQKGKQTKASKARSAKSAEEAMQEAIVKRRNYLELLKGQVHHGLYLLKSMLNSGSRFVNDRVCELTNTLLLIMKSPVTSSLASECWFELSKIAFPNPNDRLLAYSIAYTTLRLRNFPCQPDPPWVQTPKEVNGASIVQRLLKRANCSLQRSDAAMENSKDSPLPTSAFAFSFPLLLDVLTAALERKNESDNTCDMLLFIDWHISHVCADRSTFPILNTPCKEIIEFSCRMIKTVNRLFTQNLMIRCLRHLVDAMLHTEQLLYRDVFVTLLARCLDLMFSSLNQALKTSLMEVAPKVRMQNFILPFSQLIEEVATALRDDLPGFAVCDLFTLKFCSEVGISEIAGRVWDQCALKLPQDSMSHFLKRLDNNILAVREMVGMAICQCVKDGHLELSDVLDVMTKTFAEKSFVEPRVVDDFGRVLQEAGRDNPAPRLGIASVLKDLSQTISSEQFPLLFERFTLNMFADRDANVRHAILEACVEGVKQHGKTHIPYLFEQLDFALHCPTDASHDALRMAGVVLSGTLAQHLDPEDPRIKTIFISLIENLSVQSQLVQESVANCLAPLVPSVKELVPEVVEKLLTIVLGPSGYGEKRGAAYGMAGLVKGTSVLAVRQLNVLDRLEEALVDQDDVHKREGACIALEIFSRTLKSLFDPFVLNSVSKLLLCTGDNNSRVRTAASDCIRVIMKNVSATAVRLLMPHVLSGLDVDVWRTKCGSLEVISTMANGAPRHLATMLPKVVPKLIEAAFDTHPKVQQRARRALRSIAGITKNPDVLGNVSCNVRLKLYSSIPAALSDRLVEAIENPSNKTHSCLNLLLNTEFTHYIDAGSLALIMPIIKRGFEDRSPEARKTSAIVTGNIYTISDKSVRPVSFSDQNLILDLWQDVKPYLSSILPGLQKCLLDPVPEIRTVAAKAMGKMVRAAGEGDFSELLQWLRNSLVANTSPVDRSGAAQGLSEIIGGLGESYLVRVMPEIVEVTESDKVTPYARDGYIMMLAYLPTIFGDRFLPFLEGAISIIMKALADETDFVRNSALLAGRNIVNLYSDTAVPLLLPSLEKGMFDEAWRIRLSSLQLLSEVLFKITGEEISFVLLTYFHNTLYIGISGKMTTVGGEDDTFGSVHTLQAILDAVGEVSRDRILSGLYISRYDEVVMVKQTATHAWKVVVANTPRTLREIMPTLFSLLLNCISSTSLEKQKIAGNCLASLVTKLGERLLLDIVPVLEEGLSSKDCDHRRGVCIALSAVMQNMSRETVSAYASKLMPTMVQAMCDESADVRKAASAVFAVFFSSIDSRSSSDLVETLLKKLTDPKVGQLLLDSLLMITETRGKFLIPKLIPKLIHKPIRSRAVALLFSNGVTMLSDWSEDILAALFTALTDAVGTAKQAEELENFDMVIKQIVDTNMMQTLMRMMREKVSVNALKKQQAAAALFYQMCHTLSPVMEEVVNELLGIGLRFYNSDDPLVCSFAADGVSKCISTLRKEKLPSIISIFYQLLFPIFRSKKADRLPVFAKETGLQPLFAVVRECVISGKPVQKDEACRFICALLTLCSDESVKPYAINTVGPMIRVLMDRQPVDIKLTILLALLAIFNKAKSVMRPLIPQLQSTFMRLLNEPASTQLRLSASDGLVSLGEIHPKRDSLIVEVFRSMSSQEESSKIVAAHMPALRGLLSISRVSLTKEIKSQMQDFLLRWCTEEKSIGLITSGCLGVFICNVLTDSEVSALLDSFTLDEVQSVATWSYAVAIMVALKTNPEKIMRIYGPVLVSAANLWLCVDKAELLDLGIRCSAYILAYQLKSGNGQADNFLAATMARNIRNKHFTIGTLCSDAIRFIADSVGDVDEELTKKVLLRFDPKVRQNMERCLMSVAAKSAHAEDVHPVEDFDFTLRMPRVTSTYTSDEDESDFDSDESIPN